MNEQDKQCGARRPGWENGPAIGRHRIPCVLPAGHSGDHRDGLRQQWSADADEAAQAARIDRWARGECVCCGRPSTDAECAGCANDGECDASRSWHCFTGHCDGTRCEYFGECELYPHYKPQLLIRLSDGFELDIMRFGRCSAWDYRLFSFGVPIYAGYSRISAQRNTVGAAFEIIDSLRVAGVIGADVEVLG